MSTGSGEEGKGGCVLAAFVWLAKLEFVIGKCREAGKQTLQCCALSKHFRSSSGWEHSASGSHSNQPKLQEESEWYPLPP